MNKTNTTKLFILPIMIFAMLIVAALLFSFSPITARADEHQENKLIINSTIDDDFEDNSLIVTLQPSVSCFRGIDNSITTLLNSIGTISVKDLSQFPEEYVNADGSLNINVGADLIEHYKQNPFMQMLYIKLNTHDKQNVLDKKCILDNDKNIYSVSPNTYMSTKQESTPYYPTIPSINDPRYNEQWALSDGYDNGGMGIPDAWKITKGSKNIRVGIMDTGIAQHDDLDNSVNRDLGGDFFRYSKGKPGNNTFPLSTLRDKRHGTAVAGIIAAEPNNGIGISGIAPNTTVASFLIDTFTELDFRDTLDMHANAIYYARNTWWTDNRISILNYSYSGYGFSSFLTMLTPISDYNGLFVWSAGNENKNVDNRDAIEQFQIPNLISVGARDRYNERSIWNGDYSSNYGQYTHIFAPGGKGNGDENSERVLTTGFNNDYFTFGGTSAAAPHVAGVAALMLSVNPELTGAQLKEILIASADDITISTPDGMQQAKNLNAYKAVHWANPYLCYAQDNYFTSISRCNPQYYYRQTSDKYQKLGKIPSEYAGKIVIEISSHCFDGESISEITIPETITYIGNYAFANNPALSQIIIPKAVIHIGDYAFANNTALSEVAFPSRVKKINNGCFKGCTTLTTFTQRELTETGQGAFDSIPKLIDLTKITEIGSGAFNGCKQFDYVQLNLAIKEIKDYTFANCTNLDEILMGDVTTLGDYAFLNCINLKNAITFKLESIGKGAFMGCKKLTSCYIDNVTDINEDTFNGCTSLNTQVGSKTEAIRARAFYNCKSLTKFIVPKPLYYISDEAFFGCSNLVVPEALPRESNSIQVIGDNAFNGCTRLTNFVLSKDIEYVKPGAFDNTNANIFWDYATNNTTAENFKNYLSYVTISTNRISENAFKGCLGLRSIEIPQNVQYIGSGAFSDCTNLSNVYYRASDCEIAPGAFTYAGKTADDVSIHISNTVIKLPKNFLSSFYNLKEINVPYSVTEIEEQAFRTCKDLETVTVDSANNVYKSDNNCIIRKDNNILVAGCKTSIIPDYVTEIGDYAFTGLSIENISLPEGVTAIGDYAFADCTELIDIVFPQSLTTISDYSFSNCSKLNNVTLPSALSHIGRNAFEKCDSFTELTMPSSVQSIEIGAFLWCKKLSTATFEDGCYFDETADGMFYLCTALKTVHLPNSITTIPRDMFMYCRSLQNVDFGIDSHVQSTNRGSFNFCNSLSSITFPDSILYISSGTFSGCDNLRCVYIDKKYSDSSVAKIAESFYYLPNFEGIYFTNYIAAEAHRAANPEHSYRIFTDNYDWVLIYNDIDNIDTLHYLTNFNIIKCVRQSEIENELFSINNGYDCDYYYGYGIVTPLYYKLFSAKFDNFGILLSYDIEQEAVDALIRFAYYYNLPLVITNEEASYCDEFLMISSGSFNIGNVIGTEYLNVLHETDQYEYFYDIYYQVGYLPIFAPAVYKNNVDFLLGVSSAFGNPICIISEIPELYDLILNCYELNLTTFMVFYPQDDFNLLWTINGFSHIGMSYEACFFINNTVDLDNIDDCLNSDYYNSINYYFCINTNFDEATYITSAYRNDNYIDPSIESIIPYTHEGWVYFWESIGYGVSVQDIAHISEMYDHPRFMYYYIIKAEVSIFYPA